jgi:class 3 adenylate cyclase
MSTEHLPSEAVTLLFTDVEGSTRLLSALGAEAYADALAEHRRVLRVAFEGYGGVEVDTQGDAFFFTFADAPNGLGAASRPARCRFRLDRWTGTGSPICTRVRDWKKTSNEVTLARSRLALLNRT